MIPEVGKKEVERLAVVPERRLYPVNDVATLMGITPRKVWQLIYDKHLATKRIGSRRLVPAEEVDRFIASLPDGETTEPIAA